MIFIYFFAPNSFPPNNCSMKKYQGLLKKLKAIYFPYNKNVWYYQLICRLTIMQYKLTVSKYQFDNNRTFTNHKLVSHLPSFTLKHFVFEMAIFVLGL